jgi:predicted RNA-binding protein associated with RNAse of E/G family
VFAARPAILVADGPEGTMFYVPPVVTVLRAVGPDGTPWRLPYPGWHLEAHEWRHHAMLSFAFPDTPYGVLARFDPATFAFDGWYLNLQDPLRRTAIGFDTTDHVLDVVIPADERSWAWKDEDELVESLALGMMTETDAANVRWAGERAVEHVLLREPPFDEDWRGWRPDPTWEMPVLPPTAADPLL